MMGVAFASVGPMLSMAAAPDIGPLGIVIGAVVSAAFGLMHFEKVGSAAWFDIVLPFHFSLPQFHLLPIVTRCIVMIVVIIQSPGIFLVSVKSPVNRSIRTI